jgi:CheY-like chemotaxis protein
VPDRGTILVVDDDHLTCELVQGVLAAEGFHVLIATTGPEALALFR